MEDSSVEMRYCETTQPHQRVRLLSAPVRPELCCAGTQVKRRVVWVDVEGEGGQAKSSRLYSRDCHQSSSWIRVGGMPSEESQEPLPRGTK